MAAWLARPATANESRITWTLQADGRSVVRNEATLTRAQVEQQVRRYERIKRMNAADDDDNGIPKPPPVEKDPKPYTDEELAKKYREVAEGDREQNNPAGETKLESIDVKSNIVRTVTTVAYATLEELLRNSWTLWSQSGLAFENLRFEKDTNSYLRVTLTPHSGYARWAKNARQIWKQSGLKSELRFVFPGKVLSSGLPGTEGNATWIEFDAKKEETLAPAVKLYDAPTVITAELGGLKLDAPLESKVLQRQAGRGGRGDSELPITDAGPGFTAEALSVTITTVHYFPEGAKYRKEAQGTLGYQPTGAVVQAKLFAPKGRTLQSVSGVRVVKAVDEKGRPIAAGAADEDSSETIVISGGSQGPGNSTQIQLRLPLPASEAQSIEQLDAEAIVATAGNWKELTVRNVSVATTNEIDLASVLAGAKMVLRKVTRKQSQTTIEGELKGPPSIRQIEVTTRIGDSDQRSMAHASERGFTTKDNVSTRRFQLQSYSYSEDGEAAAPGTLSIVVRFPEDQKRGRVKFTLKGLDLF
ncbi:MAG TPA: hypothetical protein VFT34_04795 [Verrucomicrobiae bacterium]|nr:hypothetical protein [Verrucomicrobiae bacterium]